MEIVDIVAELRQHLDSRMNFVEIVPDTSIEVGKFGGYDFDGLFYSTGTSKFYERQQDGRYRELVPGFIGPGVVNEIDGWYIYCCTDSSGTKRVLKALELYRHVLGIILELYGERFFREYQMLVLDYTLCCQKFLDRR